MKICANDTETNGLPLWREPSEDPRQPHIVQCAALLISDTPEGAVLIESMNRIVRPDGWSWTEEDEAFKAHGITMERAMDEGVPEADVIAEFHALQAQADMRVAHNASFDDRIYRIAFKRYGDGGGTSENRRDVWESYVQEYKDSVADAFAARPKFCTMRATTDVLKLPPTEKMKGEGFTKYKQPKLTEAFKHYFGFVFDGAHDALVDAKACADIYLAIQRQIHVPVFTATP